MNALKLVVFLGSIMAVFTFWQIARQGGPRQAVGQAGGPREKPVVEPAVQSTPLAPASSVRQFRSRLQHSPGPVLVEFTASWCPYCRKQAPVLKQLAQEYQGKVNFIQVDIDVVPEVARAFGVTGVPSMMLMNGEKSQTLLTGYRDGDELRMAIDGMLNNAR